MRYIFCAHLIAVAGWIYVIKNSLRSIWKKASFITGKLSLKRIHSKEPRDTDTETEKPAGQVQNLWLFHSEHNYPWESLKGNKLNPRCTPGNKHRKYRIAFMSIIHLVKASSSKQDSIQKCVTVFCKKNILLQLRDTIEYSYYFSVKPESPGEL